LFGYKRNGPTNTAIVGLQINLPVFDRNQGAIAAAQADTLAAEQTLAATRSRLLAELTITKREYEMRRDQCLQVFKPLLDQANQISEITRLAYREGGIDLVRLLDAERLRIEAQLTWVEALAQYHRSVAGLEYAEGVDR
jgi:cobalt-zinc-cadmium efflux system outer membrane protein